MATVTQDAHGELITSNEAAIRYGLDPRVVRRRIQHGRIQTFKSGLDKRKRIFYAKDFERLLEHTPVPVKE